MSPVCVRGCFYVRKGRAPAEGAALSEGENYFYGDA